MNLIKKSLCYVSTLLLCGCHSDSMGDIPAVGNFNAGKYMGHWYEIARLPNYFEKDLQCVTANYTLLPSGRIQVRNCGVKNNIRRCITGEAKLRSAADKGELLVSFQWPFYGAYRIIYLKDDYSVAMVTGSRKKYFWILSRTPKIPAGELETLLQWAKVHGFETEKLIYPMPLN